MKLYSDAELAQILDKKIFHKIGEVADEMHVECYLVGGYVRDIFLERPTNDIDVVVVGSGIDVAKALQKKLGLNPKTGKPRAHLAVYRNFGTAQVKYYDTEVEFVGARRESYDRNSRKPVVEDGTLEDDQNRRDFTINAMAVCLNQDRFGELVDPFDGIYDLEDGIIRTPLDPDITFSDDPLRMMRCVRFSAQLRFYIDDETFDALGRNAERIKIEFVGARRESYDRNSRKPVVEDGTLEDDQNRRDFTINAMAVCLNQDRFGELVDPFDGIYDLEDGIIRTPLDPDITFSDDPLRMMRCVRFSAQLRFYIDDETFDALGRNAERIKIVSGERIADELNKIMKTPQPSRGFVELQRCGLLQLIIPELAALDIVETRNGRAHKNNFYHTLEVVDNVAKNSDNLWLRWAALFHDIGKPKSKRWEPAAGWTFHNHNYLGAKMIPSIFRRMKLPMDAKMKYVEKLVDLHMRPIVIADEEVTDSAVRRLMNDAGDDIDDLMTLCEADITSKNEVRKKQFRENFRMVREKLADLKERDYKRLLQPVVDGNEIMELFGLKPCREVGLLKQYLKDAVLDNRVANEHEPLMQLLTAKAKEMGLEPLSKA